MKQEMIMVNKTAYRKVKRDAYIVQDYANKSWRKAMKAYNMLLEIADEYAIEELDDVLEVLNMAVNEAWCANNKTLEFPDYE